MQLCMPNRASTNGFLCMSHTCKHLLVICLTYERNKASKNGVLCMSHTCKRVLVIRLICLVCWEGALIE